MTANDDAGPANGDNLLSEFGQILFKRFDHTLDMLRTALTTEKLRAYRALQQYLATLPEGDREIAVAQYALEGFVHDLMATFQESEEFAIVAKSGDLVNIRDFAVPTLEFEQISWQEKYSRYPSLTQKIV